MRLLSELISAPGTYRVTKLKLAPDNTGKRVSGSMTVTCSDFLVIRSLRRGLPVMSWLPGCS